MLTCALAATPLGTYRNLFCCNKKKVVPCGFMGKKLLQCDSSTVMVLLHHFARLPQFSH